MFFGAQRLKQSSLVMLALIVQLISVGELMKSLDTEGPPDNEIGQHTPNSVHCAKTSLTLLANRELTIIGLLLPLETDRKLQPMIIGLLLLLEIGPARPPMKVGLAFKLEVSPTEQSTRVGLLPDICNTMAPSTPP